MAHDDSSSDEECEEDPNIPIDVGCRRATSPEGDDDFSISSELSDRSMTHYGLSYDCKPDISEVANLTLAVNYGDLANMASDRSHVSAPPNTALDPGYSMGSREGMTWSQMLDGEPQPAGLSIEQKSRSFLWTQGYDPNSTLSGGARAPPRPLDTPFRPHRRSSDTVSLSGLPRRPRPFNALKRFLDRKHSSRSQCKKSSSTAETHGSSLQGHKGRLLC